MKLVIKMETRYGNPRYGVALLTDQGDELEVYIPWEQSTEIMTAAFSESFCLPEAETKAEYANGSLVITVVIDAGEPFLDRIMHQIVTVVKEEKETEDATARDVAA